MGGLGSMGDGGGNIAINTPDGSISVDTSKLAVAAKKMEEAGKRMEAAQASGDPAAAGKAMADMMGAMAGGAAFPTDDMKAWLPTTLAGQARTSFEVQGGAAMGIAGSTANASYGTGDSQMHLTVTDAGGMAALAGLAAWANMTVDKETATSVEKVYKAGNRSMREEYQKDGSQSEVTAMLGNGLIVELKGDQVPVAKVKQALAELDLSRMESAKRPAAKQ
ncbi:MAG: YIP1 family protein, partial [Rhodoferax sp.]